MLQIRNSKFEIRALLLAACLLLPGCQGGDRSVVDDHADNKPVAIKSPVVRQPTLALAQVIRPRDRVLWVGDELTQQMIYTRAAATALVSIFPQMHLRFYNGGTDGATARSTIDQIDGLMKLTHPTVVFVCLGLNDALDRRPQSEVVAKYEQDLGDLVVRIKGESTVRQVVLLGPPAVEAGLTQKLDPGSYNATLLELGHAADRVAQARRVDFIDLFVHTSAVYLGQMEVGAEPLTFGGRMPTEAGQVIIASTVLRGIGMTGDQLDKVSWSPLIPREMGHIRPALAVSTRMPSVEEAQRSRDLYLTMLRNDDLFFRLWRLSGDASTDPSARKMEAEVELAWENVDGVAQTFSTPAARPRE